LRFFQGYTDKAATEKKIITNVLRKGDSWFRTGDLVKADVEGFIYFVDRIGDTFRWKGENVATSEVADIVYTVPGVKEANVYGVTVPNYDGRVGMVALIAGDNLDMQALYAGVTTGLPLYAVPMFVRLLQREMDITATLKLRKVELVAAGFDPKKSDGDPLYFRDDRVKKYIPLDEKLFQELVSGFVRV